MTDHPDPQAPFPGPDARRPRRRMIAAVAAAAAVAVAATAGVIVANIDSPAAAPNAAPTTPDVAALAGDLAMQDVDWAACEFAAGDPQPGVDVSNVECASIRVPRDWLDPVAGETWDLRISRTQNIDTADPDATTLLLHPGGPFPGLSFSATMQQWTPEMQPTTNYISFDQRGIGTSSTVTCAYEYDPDDGPTAEARAIGSTCAEDADLATMTTEQVAYDMDFIRHLLGVEKVSFLGYSYGTWLGTWFGTLFADNIEAMVLDSVIDGTSPTYEKNWKGQDVSIDRQLRLQMMNWLARNDAVYALGDDPEAIWDRYFDATGSSPEMDDAAYLVWAATGAATLQAKPVHSPFVADVIVALIAEGESDAAGDAATRATRVIRSLGLPAEATEPMIAQFAVFAPPAPTSNADGIVEATFSSTDDVLRCVDGQWTQGEDAWNEYSARMADTAPFSAQLQRFDEAPVCVFWPTDVRMPDAHDRFPETIVVHSELDPLTPWEQGERMGAALPNTSLIAVDDEGVHGVFPYGTDEVDRPILDLLLGRADRPGETVYAAAKPLPLEQQTFSSWAPLDGDRTDPGFTDPFRPAPTAVLTSTEETP
ncbi:alpha/beta fold hydrolase [Microbacterium sp. NPDC089695]|uniref:alpha/beta fold hydrolase n=1 Tax=Microbacterium sp. NPDC089695 TaxID=3364198 RepID=UPI0038088DB6